MKAQSKFLVGSAIIVLTLVSLAYVGYTQSKTYYHTISELRTLQGASLEQHMRVSGNVREGFDRPSRWPHRLRARRAGKSTAHQLRRPRSLCRTRLRTAPRLSSKET